MLSVDNLFREREILAFTHIKKCAGTTLEHILRINFFGRYCEVRNLSRELDMGSRGVFQAEDMKQVLIINPFIKCIAGHTVKPFGSLVRSYPRIKFITLVRDPVKRHISQYIYSADRSGDKRTFQEYLEKETISNKQIRTIAGSDDLSLAKDILHERFLLVGIAEEFDEFLVLLKKKLEPFKFEPGYRPQNVGNKNSLRRKTFLENELDRYVNQIRDRNSLDIELYNHVKDNILAKEKEKYGANFEKDVNKFKSQKKEFSRNSLRYLDYICRKCYYNPVFSILRKYNHLV